MVKMKGYRTLIVAFLTIIVGVLAQTNWVAFMADPKAGAVAIVLGIIMVTLRVVTTTPIFEKTQPPSAGEEGKKELLPSS